VSGPLSRVVFSVRNVTVPGTQATLPELVLSP
jgi:hypothetical protein